MNPGQIYFSGDYDNWTEAARQCPPPCASPMLAAVLSAMLQVQAGQAVAQRDGTILNEIPHNFPLICTLLTAAIKYGGHRLHVLDFGGSLGVSYFYSRDFLRDLTDLTWSVVELPDFVAAGKKHFESQRLAFHETIDEGLRDKTPDVIVLSGVLQCLPDPWGILQKLLQIRAPFLFVDRTALIDSDSDRLAIQHVPASFHGIDKPVWFLSESKLLTRLSDASYHRVCDFPAIDKYTLPGARILFKGFIFSRLVSS